MNRDELVERVARDMMWSGYIGLSHVQIDAGWAKTDSFTCDLWRRHARTALAIIEPAVREECARVAEAAEAGCFDGNLGNFCWRIAVAIRAGAKA